MSFSPRLNANGIYNNPWWYDSGNIYYPSYQLPNCTCYCYGRYAEILGKFYPLPSADGGGWYSAATNFKRGQLPQLGAIACWYSPNGKYAGHVAVVEQINSNGDIVTSNSGYYRPINTYPPSTKNYFWTEVCNKSNGYRSSWMISRGYQLAGFIYLDGEPLGPIPTEWIKGNRYLNDDEMRNNAYIVYTSYYRTWSLPAICGVLGNMQRESTINPGIWESLIVNPSHGFGLVGWTPSTVYTDWAKANGFEIDDGDGQLKWIDEEIDKQHHWIPTSKYPISYSDFKVSDKSPEDLASAFMYNFERPGVLAEEERRQFARQWFEYLQTIDPSNPWPNPHERRKRMPVWMKIRYRR